MQPLKKTENQRATYIQNCLEKGLSREEISKTLGYKSWRGLDIYMRRKGMKWNSQNGKYYPSPSQKKAYDINTHAVPEKISRVISKFDSSWEDPVKIAVECGFKNHRELSSYMAARGYIWSPEENNYIADKKQLPKSTALASQSPLQADITFEERGMEKYVEFLDILIKNRDRLLSLIQHQSSPGTIPRYIVPGVTRTKSFYMSDSLSALITEYSQIMNISQKEIIEAAVIEFLRKYSFKNQVDSLLGSSNS